MKTTLCFATLSLLLSSPFAFSKSELEILRDRCAEQERQIRQLEDENMKLLSLTGESRGNPHGLQLISTTSPAATKESAADSHYTIRRGDTLAKVARANGLTVQAIAKANGIKDPSKISVGQKLKLPGGSASTADNTVAKNAAPVSKPAPATSNDGQIHTVRSGETFYSIAKKYHVSTQSLVAANPKVKPSAMRVGQQIRISGSGKSEPTAAAEPIASKPAAPAPSTNISNPKPLPAAKTPAAATASAPQTPAKPVEKKPIVRSVTIDGEMTYGQFAAQHGTDTARLNDLNGLDLSTTTVLAKGSELYVTAQP
jgi:LysM repeat protein